VVKAVHIVILALAGMCAAAPQQSTSEAAIPRPSAAIKPDTGPPAAAVTPSSGALTRYEGLPVREIRIDAPSAMDPALVAQLPQKANQPLDRKKVRASVEKLFASRRFNDIQVQAEKDQRGEITLVFVADENFFVNGVFVDGVPPHAPTATQLINATKLELGELFTNANLEAAKQNMKRLMADNGYFHAEVTSTDKRNPKTQQLDVFFHVNHGPLAKVGQVTFRGDSGFDETQLPSITKLHTGDTVSAARVRRALERLRKRYQRRDRLEAQVALVHREYHEDTNRLDYVFGIERGPKINVAVEGAHIRKGLVKKYVPVYEENAVDDDLLNEGRRNLRDYMQTKGYFDVNVDYTQKQITPDERTVFFNINKGDRHKLIAVDIEGNKYFDRETLLERMQVQPANYLLRQGRYSQSLLNRDAQTLQGLYQANGFQQATVTAAAEDNYLGERGRMRAVFTIHEGAQTLVNKLTFVGNSTIPEEELRGLTSITEGQPYSDANIASDRDAVLTEYLNRGFPNARFEASSTQVSAAPPRMGVTYKITEGERIFVNRVLISGLDHTREYVVRRELQVLDGQPLSQRDMLETQRRLYDLGIFNIVNIAVQNPDGDLTQKNVLLNVEEAKRYTFKYGLGFEVQTGTGQGANLPQGRTGISPRVSFDVTRLNFRGRNQTLSLKTRFGRLQQRALVSFDAPRWFGRENLHFALTGFYDSTRDVNTFTAERLEGSPQVEQTWSRATTLVYRFTYRRVKVDPNSLKIDPNLIPLLSRPVRVGAPGFTWIHDKRDDPLDAHRGSFTTFDTALSDSIFGSEANFARFLINNSTYRPVGKKKYVLARSTRFGVAEPYSGPNPNLRFIPLPERFFAGGGNSLRGFAFNQAGPRDLQTGFPLGGEALFVNQIELRTPPLPFPFTGDNLNAVLFHDMGNVFSTTKDMWPAFIKVSQDSRSNCQSLTPGVPCDFNYMSHAVGAGLRYRTPIGPVRVDFGYNLNPPFFPVRVFSDTGKPPHFERLSHFAFIFSIGQTF
jgi:outer membrane protein assembly complex protein YaeT